MCSKALYSYFHYILQLETEKEELDTVQQSIDVVKSDLRTEQQNLAQLQSKMAAEKLNWAKERAELLSHIKKVRLLCQIRCQSKTNNK